MSNDITLLQFPDTKNSGQFISAGVKFENIKGESVKVVAQKFLQLISSW